MKTTVMRLEKIMIGVYLIEYRIRNISIRRTTGVKRHLCRRKDGGWLQEIINWYPRGKKHKNWKTEAKMGGRI